MYQLKRHLKMIRNTKIKLTIAIAMFIVPLFSRPVLVDAGVSELVILTLMIVSMVGFAVIIAVAEEVL
jgi:hypothetical protein